ncbi:MAG TPA: hypothetical protein VIJ37_01080 [Steroidobacteraceae bacterium]
MTDRDEVARSEILAKLALSREELRLLLDPPRAEGHGGAAPLDSHAGEFPRSRTMQMLMNSRALSALGAIAGGLLIARPALALRLLRMLPTGALARVAVARLFSSLRTKE